MQRSHSPTTWRHPEENDTMGSTYSCGNLAPWQVSVGCVAIAEKGHLTLWLAMSGCQLVGVKKKERNSGIFFSLSQISKKPLYVCVPQFHLFCLSNQIHSFIMIIKLEKRQYNRTNDIQLSTGHQKGLYLFFCLVVKHSQTDNICRLKGWIYVYIHKDNPNGRNAYFRNLFCLQ